MAVTTTVLHCRVLYRKIPDSSLLVLMIFLLIDRLDKLVFHNLVKFSTVEMDQKENIQNEKVAGEAGGLAVKSPTGKTAVMSSRKRRIEEEPVVSVVKFRSEDNIKLLRVARQWLRSHLEFRLSIKNGKIFVGLMRLRLG